MLTGSGIYWILSGPLIGSFTVLTPGVLNSSDIGISLVVSVGVVCAGAGLWIIDQDLNLSTNLTSRTEGWLYLLPVFLVAGDMTLTVVGVSLSRNIVELNPLVSTVLSAGSAAFAAFTVSYMALSEGLGLLVLYLGRRLFPQQSSRFLPYAATCGTASFGLFSNTVLLTTTGPAELSLAGGGAAAILLAGLVFQSLRDVGPDR